MEVRIKGIKIVSCFLDGSGYAQGVRNWLTGLVQKGVPVWGQPVSFEKDRPDFSRDMVEINGQQVSIQDLVESVSRTPRECDVNFIRLSPEVAVNFIDPNMINICSCAWETSRLDKHWVDCCNKFDAIFVESEWLVDVFNRSGVNIPVYCVPNCIDATKYNLKDKEPDGQYIFYSIQQWTERKNGLGLLKSYYNAFTPEDEVLLVMKTYMTRVEQGIDQQEKLAQDIANLKKSLNLDRDYPPVYLVTDKLTNAEIKKMHEDCHCYVLLDRGEGFGLPYLDAAAAGNPIIATDFSGTRQFLNESNSYCVDCQPTYVCNMEWNPYYRGDQLWAEPNLIQASALMRRAYEKRGEAFNLGRNARATVENGFNYDVIANTLLDSIAHVVVQKRSRG